MSWIPYNVMKSSVVPLTEEVTWSKSHRQWNGRLTYGRLICGKHIIIGVREAQRMAYLFSLDANYIKSGSLKQYIFISIQFWSKEVKILSLQANIKMLAGLCSFGRHEGIICFLVFLPSPYWLTSLAPTAFYSENEQWSVECFSICATLALTSSSAPLFH